MPPRRAAAAKSAAANAALAPQSRKPTAPSSPDVQPNATSQVDGPIATTQGVTQSDEEETTVMTKRKRGKASQSKDDEDSPKPIAKRSRTAKSKKKVPEVATQNDDPDDQAPVASCSKDVEAVADSVESEKEATPEPTPRMVKVLSRGGAPVDPMFPQAVTHQVLVHNGEVYDAMLHQTELKTNANKFYALQLLHPIGNPTSLTLFTRWGRTGDYGQSQSRAVGAAPQAIVAFQKQFRSKTTVAWDGRKTMIRKPGKYFWIERDFEGEEDEHVDSEGGNANPRESTPESSAAPQVQDLIKLIFNTQMMEAHLKELNYDANKLPLGKLSKATILQGFSVLKDLSQVIEDPNGRRANELGGLQEACERLSGDYYSIIPHLFGRNRPPAINTIERVKKELLMVDALGDMTIASKLLQSSTTDSDGKAINPIDARLNGLNLKSIEPISRSSKEFMALEKYAKDSHGVTHLHLAQVTVQDIFRIERPNEEEKFAAAGYPKLEDGKRMLLWHGSRTTNFGGILSQGLRIAPPEAPVSGYMFGKGVYFADAFSKSLGYTHYHLSGNTGLLLLCEVATEPVLEFNHAAYDADQQCKKAKALATKGVGKQQPEDWADVADMTGNEELRGVAMPKGQLVDRSQVGQHFGLWYNEYIVYDTTQVRLRYLLRVAF